MSTGVGAPTIQNLSMFYPRYFPIIGRHAGIPFNNRKPFYVDGSQGNDKNDGLTWKSSLATINQAIDNAQSGDTIYVFPGSYAENVVVDKDYISIIGAQINGYGRPDVVPTSGKALYVSAAQGFYCWGVRFAAPAADTDLILHEGNGFEYDNCVFDGSATMGAAKGLLRLKGKDTDDSYTASEGIVHNCLFRGATSAIAVIFDDAAAPGNGVGCSDVTIGPNNKFVGNTLDVATADTGGAGTVYSIVRGLIVGNQFCDKNKATYIDLTTSNGGAASAQTGAINNNSFDMDTVTTTRIKMVGTGFAGAGNFYTVGVADFSGLD